jgi:hypothetical protein
MQAGDCTVSGAMPESTGCRRMLARGLAVAGLAVAGSVLFAVGTAVASEDAPSSDGSQGGLLSLGGSLGNAGDLLDPSGVLVDEPLTGVLDAVEGGLNDIEGGLNDVGVESVSPDAGPVGGSAEPGSSEPAAPAESTGPVELTDVVDTVAADAVQLASTDDRVEVLTGSELREDLAAPVAESAAAVVAPVVSAAVAPVTAVVQPVGTLAIGTLDPVVTPLEPALAAALSLVAPAVEPLAPVVHTIAPILDVANPVASVIGPVSDALSPVTDGLTVLDALAPLADQLATSPSTPTVTYDLTAAPSVMAGGYWAPRGGEFAATPTDSLHPAEEPREVAVDVVESERLHQPPVLLSGLPGLGAGALGGIGVADQTAQSSTALLPEEAVQRARFVSAAAHAAGVDGQSQREATRPSVSPD